MTKNPDDGSSLTGKVLLSMPAMGDPRFQKAVIFMCAHDTNGAMGLVVNHVMPGLDLSRLLSHFSLGTGESSPPPSGHTPIYSGGPVESARGFILHSSDYVQGDTVKISSDIYVTGTVEALKAVAAGQGPNRARFILGYAGWESGQLDRELRDNAWLVADADPDLILSGDAGQMWDRAVKSLGIEPGLLSVTAGRA